MRVQGGIGGEEGGGGLGTGAAGFHTIVGAWGGGGGDLDPGIIHTCIYIYIYIHIYIYVQNI